MAIAYQYAPATEEAPAKTPEDYLDYTLSWSLEFGPGGGSPGDSVASITSLGVSPSGTLVLSSGTIILSNQAVLFWAGSGIPDFTYEITTQILTTLGRTYTRTLLLPVAEIL